MKANKGFVIIDNGSQGGTNWTFFIVKGKKSFCLVGFGGQPGKVLLSQLPKPILYSIYKIQDINSKLSSSNCLFCFYLIERMSYYDAILKTYFR